MEASIRSPHDLRTLSLLELETLAQELRQTILTTCLKNGGHLGASLGTVELAIALHYTFESPREPIVWDVGHQAYAHKLLTGRWDRFSTLRLPGGISGFLQREESPHDVFGAGHSSTALSAALAMAWAAKVQSQDLTKIAWTVAVTGDGSLTAGLAFEALNNFREVNPGPLLVVLNDNRMSISQNSGAVPAILAGDQARGYFENYGCDYWGPVDGHDLNGLLDILKKIRDRYRGRPVVLHAITQKGKGYAPAEEFPVTYHGISPVMEKSPGAVAVPKRKTFSDAFGEALCALAEVDPRVVAITAAMKEGTGLSTFAERFPERFFDVGIAESHAVTFAAGLATRGFKPVVCIYSTFLQRALDAVIHDVAIQKLGVTFAIDRAGVVGADGPTHHGVFDLAFLGMIPEMKISAPAALSDLRVSLERAIAQGGPWAIRYPRGSGRDHLLTPLSAEFIRWHQRVAQPKLIVVALGTVALRAEGALSKLDPEKNRITLLSTLDAKPLANELLVYLRAHPDVPLLTLEEGSRHGGFGQDLIASLSPRAGAWEIGAFSDHFITHGTPEGLEDSEGLSAARLSEQMERLLKP